MALKTALVLASLGGLLLLIACPPAGSGGGGTSSASGGACVRAGDNCEYAPGKIGLCTMKTDGCEGGAGCLTCMSLH
jgi:hypothetical protein